MGNVVIELKVNLNEKRDVMVNFSYENDILKREGINSENGT